MGDSKPIRSVLEPFFLDKKKQGTFFRERERMSRSLRRTQKKGFTVEGLLAMNGFTSATS